MEFVVVFIHVGVWGNKAGTQLLLSSWVPGLDASVASAGMSLCTCRLPDQLTVLPKVRDY